MGSDSGIAFMQTVMYEDEQASEFGRTQPITSTIQT